jgi:hypothetical protein
MRYALISFTCCLIFADEAWRGRSRLSLRVPGQARWIPDVYTLGRSRTCRRSPRIIEMARTNYYCAYVGKAFEPNWQGIRTLHPKSTPGRIQGD